jgi:ADP-ribose pyrophosphatase YjhB (NUDIX family)
VELNEDTSLKGYDFVLSENDVDDVVAVCEGLKRATRPMRVALLGDPKKMYKRFKKEIPPVTAGGGIVTDTSGRLLLIKRLGYWDLPKGKLDEDETIEACAIREVEEECNIFGLNITEEFGETRHVFKRKGKYWLKISVWFNMSASETENARPQESEDIEAVRWFEPNQIDPDTLHTYPAIRDLLSQWKSSKGSSHS